MGRPHHRKTLALLGLVSPALVLWVACGPDATPETSEIPAAAESDSPGALSSSQAAPGRAVPGRLVAPRKAGNQRPVITSVRFEPPQPVPGGSLRVNAEVSDGDGDPLSISYTWRLNGELIRDAGESVSLADTKKGDAVEVTVSAGDGRSVSAPYTLSVELPNRAPELKAVRLEPDAGMPPGGRLWAVVEVDDADGDEVEVDYRWSVNGGTLPGDGPELEAAVGRGDWVSVRVVASDGEAESEPFDLPEVEIANSSPSIVSEPGAPGRDGVFRYQVTAEDLDGDHPLRFSLEQAPEGMTVDALTGLVEWLPGGKQAGRHRIEIVVHDAQGASGSQGFELVVGDEGTSDDAAGQQGG